MKIIRLAQIAALVFGLILTVTAGADEIGAKRSSFVRESVEVSNHYVFNTFEIVNGATILIRDFRNRVINASISSHALEPDYAYSIWWAVFNRPQFCIEPFRCALSDLGAFGGDPRVKASVFWGGGFVSDAFGAVNTSVRLSPGKTNRELFANTENHGLRNFRDAEIHVVLRSHGPAGLAGTIAEQIGTANEACPDQGCENVFASIHIPSGDH